MSISLLIVLAVACVAFANGANDNFKGVATLLGSGTTNYRRALWWATLTTLAGSLAAVYLASGLFERFRGGGLVPDALTEDPEFLAAVALGAGLTVLLATRLGMPISTTHALVGALVGAGLAAHATIDGNHLASRFLAPLLFSPLLALGLTVTMQQLLHRARVRMGVDEQSCVCVGTEQTEVELATANAQHSITVGVERLGAFIDGQDACQTRAAGTLLGVKLTRVVDTLHYVSAGAVSFARGLNDTPKIAALLLAGSALSVSWGAAATGIVIALGGLLAARRVAETLSHKITPMNHGQGLTANLATSLVVIGASRFGLPVSTTHVSCGSLFGLGALTGAARWRMIGAIVAAWVITLPLAGALAAFTYWVLALS